MCVSLESADPQGGVSAVDYRLITKTQEPLSSNIIVSDDHDGL